MIFTKFGGFRYDDMRGRHVVANKAINAEEILFVEKAFVFAPIFINEDMDLQPRKCYHCLRNFVNPIPSVFHRS